MRYCEREMDQTPETESSKVDQHREYLKQRHLERIEKVLAGELTPEQAAEESTQREVELEDRADHDGLTGLLNFQGFTDTLTEDLPLIQRYGTPAYLGLFDGDKLRELNNTVGKLEGNKAIQTYADVLRQIAASRPNISMKMGRFGGDEFILLVTGEEAKEAREIFEELRTSIPPAVSRALNMPALQSTISIGVVKVGSNDNTHTLLNRADEKLRQAKTERNKLVFEDLPSTLVHK